jgi:hypothetical protein
MLSVISSGNSEEFDIRMRRRVATAFAHAIYWCQMGFNDPGAEAAARSENV